jgi:hypothetical protein
VLVPFEVSDDNVILNSVEESGSICRFFHALICRVLLGPSAFRCSSVSTDMMKHCFSYGLVGILCGFWAQAAPGYPGRVYH